MAGFDRGLVASRAVRWIEKRLALPAGLVSVGLSREQTIVRRRRAPWLG